jgi:hypothetical protein
VELPEDLVGRLGGEHTLSFQHVMEMRLGDAGYPGDAPFGQAAGSDAFADLQDEAFMQLAKVHGTLGLFPSEIEYYDKPPYELRGTSQKKKIQGTTNNI